MNTFLLAVLAVCAVVLTALSLVNFLQLQWTLREIRQTAGTVRQICAPAERTVLQVENAVRQVCDTTLGFVHAASFLGKRWGVRTGPRTRRHG